MKNDYFYLFGKVVCDLFINEHPMEDIKTKLVCGDGMLFHFKRYAHTPTFLLSIFNGWDEYCEISEEEYNMLNVT